MNIYASSIYGIVTRGGTKGIFNKIKVWKQINKQLNTNNFSLNLYLKVLHGNLLYFDFNNKSVSGKKQVYLHIFHAPAHKDN